MTIEEVVRSKEDAIFGKGASVREVENAEKKLGLKFAKDYKEYLEKFSSLMYDGHELTGITKVKRVNVVDVTLQHLDERDSKDKYVLEDTGIEGIVIWQNTKGEIFEGKKRIYSSLIDYLSE